MSDISQVLKSHLDEATDEEKTIFFQTLLCLSGIDGVVDDAEIDFIAEAAAAHGIPDLAQLGDYHDEKTVLKNLEKIKNRPLALELIREMCSLAHVDNVLSDEETLLIGQAGLAMGIEMEKIEQISNWVIDRIIWREQAKIIFEEK